MWDSWRPLFSTLFHVTFFKRKKNGDQNKRCTCSFWLSAMETTQTGERRHCFKKRLLCCCHVVVVGGARAVVAAVCLWCCCHCAVLGSSSSHPSSLQLPSPPLPYRCPHTPSLLPESARLGSWEWVPKDGVLLVFFFLFLCILIIFWTEPNSAESYATRLCPSRVGSKVCFFKPCDDGSIRL